MHLNNFDSFFVPTAKGDIFCKKAGRGAPLYYCMAILKRI